MAPPNGRVCTTDVNWMRAVDDLHPHSDAVRSETKQEDMLNRPSDFAVNQLKKFGWSEGDGLGKNKNGISEPIKASMKFSRRGLGATYQTAEIDGLLWSSVYEKALSPVVVSNTFIWPKVEFVSAAAFQVDESPNCRKRELVTIKPKPQRTHGKSKDVSMSQERRKRKRRECGGVSVKDIGDCVEMGEEKDRGTQAVKKMKCPREATGAKEGVNMRSFLNSLSGTCLLELGNGRTGHPAARFGIRCGGKLARAAKYL
ncbi:unnamed protein product [Hydatigera taeniaeformis]|uniref:G patch domain-containing protein 4 n=1 Tax=Hydatigena taeniaeformis TaxID=6205 RepID=A0A0R3WT74_HYDTA|nr:unnamed protein product [Hydatigera taeniaeformis]